MFSCYHLYLAAGNSTTIEGWEKDKVATLVRRGKIHDVKYPYVSPAYNRNGKDVGLMEIECRVFPQPEISFRSEPTTLALAPKDARRWTVIPGQSGRRW